MKTNLVSTNLDVNLSVLLKTEPKLFPDELVELKMIEFYRYYQDEENNIYKLFTKYLLNRIYRDEIDHDVNDIFNFYKCSMYNNIIIEFNNKLDLILTLKSKMIDFINIEFNSYLEKAEDKLLVRFNLITVKE